MSNEISQALLKIIDRITQKLPYAAEEISLPSDLIIQVEGAPSWWREGGNILLAPPGSQLAFPSYVGSTPPRNAIVVVGPYFTPPRQLLLAGDSPIVFLGPHCSLPNGTIICANNAMIVLAGNLFAIDGATLDARNGGTIYVGDDNLWSSNIKITTDDMHAIFDCRSSKRINRYGSTVTIGTHVWLGQDTLINPGVTVSDNVVIGSRSVVTKHIPMGCVAVGAPARVARRGTTWTREDIPPDIFLPTLNLEPRRHGFRSLARKLIEAATKRIGLVALVRVVRSDRAGRQR